MNKRGEKKAEVTACSIFHPLTTTKVRLWKVTLGPHYTHIVRLYSGRVPGFHAENPLAVCQRECVTTYKTKLPLPERGIGEVRLRVQAIGLNRVLGSSVTPGCLHFVIVSWVFAMENGPPAR